MLFTREGIVRRLRMLRTTAEVWLLVTWLKQFSSAAGPGTSLQTCIRLTPDNIGESCEPHLHRSEQVDLRGMGRTYDPSAAFVRDDWPSR